SDRLRRHRIIARTAGGAYVLARHPGHLSLAELAALVPTEALGEGSLRTPAPPSLGRIDVLLETGRAAFREQLKISLEELLNHEADLQPTSLSHAAAVVLAGDSGTDAGCLW